MTKTTKLPPDTAQGPVDVWQEAGEGVRIYVLDDGIRLQHKAFQSGSTSRAVNFKDQSVTLYTNPPILANPLDQGEYIKGCHGTHVASLAGGAGYGTARSATIVNVRVIADDGSGDIALWTRAIIDITAEHENLKKSGNKGWRGSVITMSLSTNIDEEDRKGANLDTLRQAIELALAAGIPVIASAGNDAESADDPENERFRAYPCWWSKTTDLICVGNVDKSYRPASHSIREGSSFGSQISIWAPGEDINGAHCRADSNDVRFSGTSQSTPFVAGVIASFLGYELLSSTAAVRQRLFDNSNRLVESATSTKLLLNTGIYKGDQGRPYLNAPSQPAGGAQPPQPPQVSLTCYSVKTKKWMGRDALQGNIGDFCKLAGEQGIHDPDSGSIMRQYNVGGDYVALNIDWPADLDWKADALQCFEHMRTIMYSCDGLDSNNNPFNWTAGGELNFGSIKYRITPLSDRYTPGYCNVGLHERADWKGNDVTGAARQWTFWLVAGFYDSLGAYLGGTDANGVEAGKDGVNPYVFRGLYAPMEITPQGAGNMPVSFSIGDNFWRNTDSGKFTLDGAATNSPTYPGQHCEETEWDSTFHVWEGSAGRDIRCWFPC